MTDLALGGTPTTLVAGDTAYEGEDGAAARSRHRHGMPSSMPPSGTAGGDLTGSYPNPTIAASSVTDTKVAAANKDGAAGTASMRTLGTGAAQAAAGNHTHTSLTLDAASTIGGVSGTDLAADRAAWTSYSPSFTNVTSGAGTFKYLLTGKTLKVKGNFSAGTATGAAVIQISLPASATALHASVVPAQNNNALVSANVTTGGGTVRIGADTGFANWGVGASVANVHYNGEFEVT